MLNRSFILLFSLVANSAFAQDGDTIVADVTYLSEPTAWCPVDKGVPAVVSYDGPNVFVDGINEEDGQTVTVRRGSELSIENAGPIQDSEIRTLRGGDELTVDTTTTLPGRSGTDGLVLLGRMEAKFNVCQTMWSGNTGSGLWVVNAPDGSLALAGNTENTQISGDKHPFLQETGSFPVVFQVGEQRFVVLSEPTYERTLEAFVSPGEE